MRRWLLLLVVAAPVLLRGQTPHSPLAFEVASIKRSSPDATLATPSVIGEVLRGGVWRAKVATVYGLIRRLYPNHSLPGQIEGVSGWMGTEFYDIDARATASSSADEMQEMARTLLADRFKLKMHTETREMPAYLLFVARKDGRVAQGLTKPAMDCDAYRKAQQSGDPLPADPTRKRFGDRRPCTTVLMPVFNSTRVIPGAQLRISAGSATIADIVEYISRELARPVINKTGLGQLFDIEVHYSLVPTVDGDSGPPLRAALADQLGLRIEDGRATTDVLVIDHVERPTPD